MEAYLLFILREEVAADEIEQGLKYVFSEQEFSRIERIIIRQVHELEEGESLLFEHTPSLLVLDTAVSGASDFVSSLKNDEMFKYLPVLVVDGADDAGSREVFWNAGADSIIPAPCTTAALLHSIRPLIRMKLLTDDVLSRVMRLQEDSIRNFILLDLVKRYIPKTVWDIACRFAEEQNIHIPETEEEVTIVYGDILGFTKISQYLEPREVISMLNEAYDVVTRIIYEYEGDIDKFIGDAFLAVFTAPRPAVLSALKIQIALKELNEDRERRGLTPFSFRIGVHTGPVIRGNVGGELRNDNTLIGDTVNTSARIESITPAGEVLVSEQTCSRAGLSIPAAYRVEEVVKGKDAPIVSYNVYRFVRDKGSDPGIL